MTNEWSIMIFLCFVSFSGLLDLPIVLNALYHHMACRKYKQSLNNRVEDTFTLQYV